jgi:small-conductance mechanosensitive channel
VFRLVQLALSVAGAVLLWRAVRTGGPLDREEPRWRLQLQRLAWLLMAVFCVAIVSNVVGNVSLADTLNSGVALSLFLGLLLHAVTQVVDVFVSVLIQVGAKESHYLAQRGAQLERVVVRGAGVVSVLLWLLLSLRGFMVWTPIVEWLTRVLTAPIGIGEVTVNLDMILLFVLVLFVGNLLARMISGVIELDVMGRMDLRRGVAVTVGSLLRYALIAVAFLVAMAAIGIDLSNLAILGGALGVGIGFGLQNIVNNFISGLLLAFERPIGIGDTVQVGPHTGDVKEIGIRASVIRTFDGAEVIVPNLELITKDVVNWTRTGTRRRIEIPVGAAYGTDPERVIKLLLEVAEQHPDVRANPAPVALFTGFGDSALTFVLRAWTDSLDWPKVRSDLTVGTNTALRDACIEVPFPQRDLHLRSVDMEALKDLRGEASQA